ncbi:MULTISPECIES: hypothetical protein [Spirosoma]|uniref:DUF4386 family protein n=1 Tax=Spirosoma sordidisoli TaxID=2502893 RepID=A0A4Q2UFM1_9BACT|nr:MULTISPECIES: hypothetical protein [Spirosoma]RYC67894.1 hypothetical protein EQG79_20735 [Spirosoma sordidisoli]
MRHTVWMFLLIATALLGFCGYCTALLDWVQDVRTGAYGLNYQEAVLETSALIMYTYLSIRFFRSKLFP